MWQQAIQVEQQIKELAKSKWCTACPTSHHNTGNIITTQSEKPPGKKKSWPGWTTQAIVIMYKTQEDATMPKPCNIRWYQKATVYQPGEKQGYAHVHVQVQQEQDTLPMNINKQIMAQRQDRPELPDNRNHFWCMVDKKNKIIYIMQAEVWPRDPIFIEDVNLKNRKDRNIIIVDKSELKSKLEQQTPVCTECGTIFVDQHTDETAMQCAQTISDRLLYNCRK